MKSNPHGLWNQLSFGNQRSGSSPSQNQAVSDTINACSSFLGEHLHTSSQHSDVHGTYRTQTTNENVWPLQEGSPRKYGIQREAQHSKQKGGPSLVQDTYGHLERSLPPPAREDQKVPPARDAIANVQQFQFRQFSLDGAVDETPSNSSRLGDAPTLSLSQFLQSDDSTTAPLQSNSSWQARIHEVARGALSSGNLQSLSVNADGTYAKLPPWSDEWIVARGHVRAWLEVQAMSDEALRSFKEDSVLQANTVFNEVVVTQEKNVHSANLPHRVRKSLRWVDQAEEDAPRQRQPTTPRRGYAINIDPVHQLVDSTGFEEASSSDRWQLEQGAGASASALISAEQLARLSSEHRPSLRRPRKDRSFFGSTSARRVPSRLDVSSLLPSGTVALGADGGGHVLMETRFQRRAQHALAESEQAGPRPNRDSDLAAGSTSHVSASSHRAQRSQIEWAGADSDSDAWARPFGSDPLCLFVHTPLVCIAMLFFT